jgi:hypothetical protein
MIVLHILHAATVQRSTLHMLIKMSHFIVAAIQAEVLTTVQCSAASRNVQYHPMHTVQPNNAVAEAVMVWVCA